MNFVDVLKKCEQATGAGSKDAIKFALAELDPFSKNLMRYMQDPFMVFGIKKIERPQAYAEVDPPPQDRAFVFGVLDALQTRVITGNAARDALKDMLAQFTENTARYFERIIDKDPRGGFSADTYNIAILAKEKSQVDGIHFLDACKIVDKQIKLGGIEQTFQHYSCYPDLVPTFTVQLADKCDTTEQFETKVVFPCNADYKKDGERTIAVVTQDEIIYYNRSGKIQLTVNGLFDSDLVKIRAYLGYDYILDGERCSHLGFIDTINAKKEGNQESKNNLRFWAFFLMPLTDWKAKKTTITTRQNHKFLADLLAHPQLEIEKILPVESREVVDYEDMMNYCNDAIDLPQNKARGIEGLILKNWDSTYIWDRSFDWVKVKRFFDVDCQIIGMYPGKKKTRLENSLGGIEVEGFLECGTRVRTKVGSGFSDQLRAQIWANPERWIGQTVVINYQEVSKSRSKEFSALRFPTFARVRDDKIVSL